MTVKVIVPVSGGKDSQACLKLALETHHRDEIMGLFCDTKFEHPVTYSHVEWMKEYYGVHIETISAGSVPTLVLKQGNFPGGKARFCTDRLKIVPSKFFYKAFAEKQGAFEVWMGMRGSESRDRELRYKDIVNTEVYLPHEVLKQLPKYLGKMGIRFRLPVLDWTTEDVFDYLDGKENILYTVGLTRVGCFPCLASGDANKEQAFKLDSFGKSQHVLVKDLERQTGKSVWISKGGKARNEDAPCAVCNM